MTGRAPAAITRGLNVAVRKNNLDDVKKYIALGANLKGALEIACEHGHLAMVQYLVETVHMIPNRTSCSQYAACKGHLEILAYLHRHDGADHAALLEACERGLMIVVRFMVEELKVVPTTAHIARASTEAVRQYILAVPVVSYDSDSMVRLCKSGKVELFRVAWKKCGGTDDENEMGELVFRALQHDQYQMMKLLLGECNVRVSERRKKDLMSDACRKEEVKYTQYLVTQQKWQPSTTHVRIVMRRDNHALRDLLTNVPHLIYEHRPVYISCREGLRMIPHIWAKCASQISEQQKKELLFIVTKYGEFEECKFLKEHGVAATDSEVVRALKAGARAYRDTADVEMYLRGRGLLSLIAQPLRLRIVRFEFSSLPRRARLLTRQHFSPTRSHDTFLSDVEHSYWRKV